MIRNEGGAVRAIEIGVRMGWRWSALVRSGFAVALAAAVGCGFAGGAHAYDLDPLFLSRESPACPVAERAPPTFRLCDDAQCPVVPSGETRVRTSTGWGADQCGFKVIHWELAWCRSYVNANTVSAVTTSSDWRVVDFLKKQCEYGLECVVQNYGRPACRVAACGVEAEGAPLRYQACRHIRHGVDQAALVARWAAAGGEERAVLRVVLLLDQNRSGLLDTVDPVKAAAVDALLAFLRQANPADLTVRARLDRLGDALEQQGAALSPGEISAIAR